MMRKCRECGVTYEMAGDLCPSCAAKLADTELQARKAMAEKLHAVLVRCAKCQQFFKLESEKDLEAVQGGQIRPMCPRCQVVLNSSIAYAASKYGLNGNVSVRGGQIKTVLGWTSIN